MGSWKLTIAGAATAFFMLTVVAFGAETYPMKLVSLASIFKPLAGESTAGAEPAAVPFADQYDAPARDQYESPPDDQYRDPADDQYDGRTNVCIDGIYALRLSDAEADMLIGRSLAVLGRCAGPHRMPDRMHVGVPVQDTGWRLNVCIGDIVQLRASYDEADQLLAHAIAARGPCAAP